MTAFSHVETHQQFRVRLVAIAGLPTIREWELVAFKPAPDTPYVSEQYVPGTGTQRGVGKGALMEYTGLYKVLLYGLSQAGPDVLHAQADLVLAAFPPGASFAMPSGVALRIRGDVAPSPGQILPQSNGLAACPISIPWRVYADAPLV